MYVYGIDIGGTTVKIGLLGVSGKLIKSFSIKTNTSDNGKYILDDIAQAIKAFNHEQGILDDDILGFGFGLPGPTLKDIAIRCPNLGWENVDVKTAFSKAYGKTLNVKASNDANVAAAGEYWQKNMTGDLVFITLGTGVGGGIITHGKVVDGAHGAGGEIGHIRVNHQNPEACSCGLDGCLETECSIRGVIKNARKYLKQGIKSSLKDDDSLTPKMIFDAAKENDPVGLKVVDETGFYLGLACSQIAVTTDPELILIGGGISHAGPILIDAITKHYKKFAHFAVQGMRFELANLGNDAGMYGAAYLIISEAKK